MQGSGGSLCPITFEEALRKEMEYRNSLEKTHPHLLLALNDAFETQKVRFSIPFCVIGFLQFFFFEEVRRGRSPT
jgi:hypothetical protein